MSVSDVMKPALAIVELAIALKRAEEDVQQQHDSLQAAYDDLRNARAAFNKAVNEETTRRIEAGDE